MCHFRVFLVDKAGGFLEKLKYVQSQNSWSLGYILKRSRTHLRKSADLVKKTIYMHICTTNNEYSCVVYGLYYSSVIL